MTISKQEFFDKTVEHLAKQGKRAYGQAAKGSVGCAYRTKDGEKCAVGCHIPDDLYKTEMEGLRVVPLLSAFPELKKHVPYDELANDLQTVHDITPVERWQTELKLTALNNGLDESSVDRAFGKVGL